ncbi:MAG: tRNA lysidine(34) synthetase TilS [Bacteroidales bacterium]|nr:tRNA lysidine(34) synthetase TilS [Bacteroidales bacterium]MCF8333524.1 tRNA lysidine(34) synthetase TilS [Bacteroidales bacterium]
MFHRFQQFVKKENLLPEKGKTLLAVSGGMDSVVLADLFCRSGFPAAIAHCNFQLRGKESESDREFVRELAGHYEVPFYVKNFETRKYASKQGISIQMAARELRYSWFTQLMEDPSLKVVATGHHLDDEIETFFINLMRGSGIRGLHGILPISGKWIHPLLFAGRNDIKAFVEKNHLTYREDSSNRTVKYQRNKIRHHLLPDFEKIHPGYRQTFEENFERIRQAEEIFKQKVQEEEQKIVSKSGEEIFLSIEKLKKLHPLAAYLYEFIAPYDFHYRQIKKILAAMDSIPGKKFYSGTHRLFKDRDKLILTPIHARDDRHFFIRREDDMIVEPITMRMTRQSHKPEVVIVGKKNIAMLDFDKLEFPLMLRKWERGDRFCPLGMQQMKKLSDFFVDNKFSLSEKERVWLLQSGDDIIWVVNNRIDDRYKVTDTTENIYRIEVLDGKN